MIGEAMIGVSGFAVGLGLVAFGVWFACSSFAMVDGRRADRMYETNLARKDREIQILSDYIVGLNKQMADLRLGSFEDLLDRISTWGYDRKIPQNSTGYAQSEKTQEELYELQSALLACAADDETGDLDKSAREEVIDAIGDIVVTLIMVCDCEDLEFIDCVAAAYEEIKDRTGYLNEDGVFVKESPCLA